MELVVLGGVSAATPTCALPGRTGAAPAVPGAPRLAVSALGEDAVLQGAVATALEVAQSRLFDLATLLDRKELVV